MSMVLIRYESNSQRLLCWFNPTTWRRWIEGYKYFVDLIWRFSVFLIQRLIYFVDLIRRFSVFFSKLWSALWIDGKAPPKSRWSFFRRLFYHVITPYQRVVTKILHLTDPQTLPLVEDFLNVVDVLDHVVGPIAGFHLRVSLIWWEFKFPLFSLWRVCGFNDHHQIKMMNVTVFFGIMVLRTFCFVPLDSVARTWISLELIFFPLCVVGE